MTNASLSGSILPDIKIDIKLMIEHLCEDLDLSSDTVLYLIRRYESEGIKFLTVTLPKLGKSLLSSLEKGFFDRTDLTCFRWKGKALAVFPELISEIFTADGLLRPDACAVAIYRVRQLSDYFYKLALETSESESRKARAAFVKTDASLALAPLDSVFVDRLRSNFAEKYALNGITHDKILSACRPRVGPGTFSSGRRPENQEVPYYAFKKGKGLYHIPERFKGDSGFFRAYPSDDTKLTFSVSDTSECSELLLVPKDSRGPRTIVREPFHGLRAQLSFFDYFSVHLERVTEGRINFTDQSVNKNLARLGSIDGSYATIDLKDASDSVRKDLVYSLLRDTNNSILSFIRKYRTEECKVTDDITIKLNKLAGMGSGFTFVMLAWLAHHSISTQIASDFNISSRDAGRFVYVYGDDIVVPTSMVNSAFSALQKVGLKPNYAKSFTTLKLATLAQPKVKYFRESCGGDYFGGSDVGTIKLRLAGSSPVVKDGKLCLGAVSRSQAIVQLNAHCKELICSGLMSLARLMYAVLELEVGKLPTITNFESQCIGRFTRFYERYATDETGAYKDVKVLTPVPNQEENPYEYVYVRLGEKFSPNQGKVWSNSPLIDGFSTVGLPQHAVAVPRSLRLKRCRVSSLHLQR